MKVSYLST